MSVKQFKIDRKKYGLKYAVKRFLVFIRRHLKLIYYYFGRYGFWKIMIWSTPIVGTVFLLSELENKGYRIHEQSNLTKFLVTKNFEHKKRLDQLDSKTD